jgi:DNA-directed RNA polymerase subunit RPC12/RpoP
MTGDIKLKCSMCDRLFKPPDNFSRTATVTQCAQCPSCGGRTTFTPRSDAAGSINVPGGSAPSRAAEGGPYNGPLADASGTVATGGTAQTVLPKNTSLTRRYILIVNQGTETLYVDFDQTATAASIPLKACTVAGDGSGGSLEYPGGGGALVPNGPLSVLGATTGHAYTIKTG